MGEYMRDLMEKLWPVGSIITILEGRTPYAVGYPGTWEQIPGGGGSWKRVR